MAVSLREGALNIAGDIPYCLLVNKADLRDEWEVTEEMLAPLVEQGMAVLYSSAKTGVGVEEAFATLARKML